MKRFLLPPASNLLNKFQQKPVPFLFSVLLVLVFGVTTKTTAQCTGPYARFESIGSSTANTTGFTFVSSGVGSTATVPPRSGKYYYQDGVVNASLKTPAIAYPKTFSFYVKSYSASTLYGTLTYKVEYSLNDFATAGTDITTVAGYVTPTVTTGYQRISVTLPYSASNSSVKFRITDTATRVAMTVAGTLIIDDISWDTYSSVNPGNISTGFPENTTIAPVQMNDGTPAVCSGTTVVLDTSPNGTYNSSASYNFYDNGGATDEYNAGPYSNQVTFKPTAAGFAAGDRIRIQFITYAVGNTGDTIEIWDDNGGTLNSTTNLLTHSALGAPTNLTYISTLSSDGSITIKFTSDGATNAAGFNIKVDCIRCTKPTNLAASSIGTTTATLNWDSTGASNYELYYSTTNTTPLSTATPTIPFGSITTNTYGLTGLSTGQTYYVWVRSYCGANNYSGWSAVASFTTVDCSAFVIATSPSSATQSLCQSVAATALSASASGGTVSSYQWYSNASNSNSGGTLISGAISSSYTPLTTSTGTLYYYCVITSTISCSVTSAVSGLVIVTTVPSAPAASAGSGATTSAITANWASLAGATDYYLDVATDSGFTSMVSGYNNLSVGNVITYSVTGLASGTTYYYRVRAANTCGSGTSSGTIITTTLTNDDCSGATSLTVNPNTTCSTSTTGTSSGATQSQSGCSGNADDDVWFKFVATSTTHIVTATPITLNDIVFQVFSGNCAGLVSTICVNSTNGSTAETTTLTGLTAGNTYYVRVYSNGNSMNAGTFTICVTTPVPPSNNQCANATNLPCGTSNLGGTTVLSNSYTHGTGCLMSNYGVWYTFTGDGNSSTISVTTTSNDIELSISTGSCGSLTNIACQDSALSSGTETYTFTTAVGVNYYIYIANWYSAGTSTDTGSFTISRTCVVPFNPCTSVPNIAACGSATSVTIPAGAGGYNPSSCGWTTPGVEQIYTFTPVSTGNFSITQTSSFTYIDYQFKPVSSGCSSSGWTCIDDMSGAATSPTFTLTAGTQYYILLDPEASTGGIVNFTINCPAAALTNDEPCTAISLTVNTTCSYSTYTNSGAVASGGITAPGCANYIGGDVWFSAVVPATGVLTVDLQTGVMTDSGMAFYSGTCGSLTLLECDDDDSTNGLMSNISMVGLTPGQTIFIRVWEYGNDNNGTFGICATTPSCPPPSDLYANILSTTSVTINWANTTPPSSNGYQYYITTTNTPPTSGSTPTGSTAAGVNGVTLTGLTAGQVYYFWVRAYCGGTDYSSWFGPTNYTPCTVGSGSGTTTLSCPSVVAGGQGLSGGDPASMVCSASTCTNLEAAYLQLNQATDYTVASIPYAPPYQYSCLQNPVSVNVDDKWSPIINLPFNFCFYGNNYNKCLIGSNGVITFDTTSNPPGGYSAWSFNADLPNTSLFKNTIFGVYHDIDPGIGGEVGWELITLNTGCRALVASWNNIPMFSSTCNSSYYTGMIVLYENTNVIDVFIKEKNICATWNNGNAIVGVQNSTGTAAVVATNRNGLSTNWAVTNEAWRFTPSGPSLTSIKWYEGGTTGTVVGTTDIINVCPSVTTVYTAEVTYALCSGTNLKYTDNVLVTVSGTKIWDGSTNTNWNIDDNWTPSGVPTSADCVVIPDVANDPVISAAPNAVGYNLVLYSNALLTVNPNQNIIITDKVTVQTNGIFTINNNSNLVQINDSAVNTGNIIYKRIAPNIKGSDYVYWSSPVLNQNMGTIYDSGTQGLRYQWNTTLNNSNGAGGNISQGLWEAANGIMTQGRGYIIRGSSNFNQAAGSIPTTFTGVPANGIIPYTVQRGIYTGLPYNGANGVQITNLNDNYNLLGNPYPSSMNALKFLQLNTYNVSTNPTGQILGNVKLWTHGTDPILGAENPFYGSYQYNYSANDYLTINYLGSTTPGGPDIIKAGQAFFVQMLDGAAGSGAVNFNNSMRFDATNTPYSNSGFYKNGTTTTNEITFERHRIWLDLVDANSQSSGILVGYATDATNNFDSLFDAPTAISGGMKIFSTIVNNTDIYEIQGRTLPFDVNDEIPIGIKAPTQGNYSFAIAAVDGLFNEQNIYLKDNLLNITHDLKANPYNFTTISGVITNRFEIVYVDNTLGNPDHSFDNTIKVMVNNEVAVSSSSLQMESIIVYNVLGQKLETYNKINSNYFTLSNLHKNNTTLLLKIKLQTGETVIKKILY